MKRSRKLIGHALASISTSFCPSSVRRKDESSTKRSVSSIPGVPISSLMAGPDDQGSVRSRGWIKPVIRSCCVCSLISLPVVKCPSRTTNSVSGDPWPSIATFNIRNTYSEHVFEANFSREVSIANNTSCFSGNSSCIVLRKPTATWDDGYTVSPMEAEVTHRTLRAC